MSKLRLTPGAAFSRVTRPVCTAWPGHGPAYTLPHSGRAVPPAVWSLVKTGPNAYLRAMFKPFEFCVPTKASIVPNGPDWLHEIKYDGYRLRLERDGDRVRLIMRGGYDWTKRYPWITEAARTLH